MSEPVTLEPGELLVGMVEVQRNVVTMSTSVTVTVPDSWFLLPSSEFTERVETLTRSLFAAFRQAAGTRADE